MRRLFLDDAEQPAVAQAVRRVLEARGALVREHVTSRVRFRLPGGRLAWERAGYVGIYRRVGEKEVEARLVLRAKWPARLLWTVALVDVVGAVLTFVLDPPGTTWFVVAFIEGAALLVAGLVHLNTWASVREEERAIMDAFETELRGASVGATIERADERALREAEAQLEGEIAERRAEAERKRAPKPDRPKPKLRLGRKGKE